MCYGNQGTYNVHVHVYGHECNPDFVGITILNRRGRSVAIYKHEV